MEAADRSVLATFADVLTPEIVEGAITDAVAALQARDGDKGRRETLTAELDRLNSELERYASAIATAGEVAVLAKALRGREHQRLQIQRELALLDGVGQTAFDARRINSVLREKLADWKGTLLRQTPLSRQLLMKLIDGSSRSSPTTSAGITGSKGKRRSAT
jgi:hypothetical protein